MREMRRMNRSCDLLLITRVDKRRVFLDMVSWISCSDLQMKGGFHFSWVLIWGYVRLFSIWSLVFFFFFFFAI
ncbi:hypothetical protein Hanom_Chr16g01452881 [Helianthus anomalus]